MAKVANDGFDPKAFLAKVGAGKTILKLGKNQHVFEQGDAADAVFYIQKGKVKLTILSEQGKEAVVLKLSNVTLTPHIAGCTVESVTRAAEMVSIDIANFYAGKPLVNCSNPGVLGR